MKFINTIKLSTVDHGLVIGYQVSFKGAPVTRADRDKSCSRENLHSPPRMQLTGVCIGCRRPTSDHLQSFCLTADGEVLHVGIEGRGFVFYTQDRSYSVPSKVTETEDVSYVSSPYLPDCLRRGARGMTSNAHRAYESAAGKSDIKDEYNEVISLGEVRVLIGEWVPFGDNSLASLMEKLGCQDRVQASSTNDCLSQRNDATLPGRIFLGRH
eukprot:750649-Hanusia_phi.AAC.7